MPLDQLLRHGQAVPIVRWGDPVLHRPAVPVTDFGPDLWDLLSTMFATNRAACGAGLAAQQIGVDLAVFVYDLVDEDGRRRVGLVCNPSIETPSGRQRRLAVEHEGCLSLPGAHSEVARADRATCHGQDQFGQPVVVEGSGDLARCLQHESDHLAGIVMEDRLTARARRRLRLDHAEQADGYGSTWPV